MNQKIGIKKLPEFQVIPILHLQVMHDYVHWHRSIDDMYCVKFKSQRRDFMQNLLLFHKEMISA